MTELPGDLHPALRSAAVAALEAYAQARNSCSRDELAATVKTGADGTPTMRIDEIVEARIVEATPGVNLLSEEIGFVDRDSALTLVVDPVDGSANAAAGVGLSCFSAALVEDAEFTQALTVWFATGQAWWTVRGQPAPYQTTGRKSLDGAAVSLLRPHPHTIDTWTRVAGRAGRIRVLGCSTLDAAMVADGSVDAFADAGSSTHRLMDLAAALVIVPAAGGAVRDAYGRPIEFDTDLSRRWSGVVAATSQLADELCELIAER